MRSDDLYTLPPDLPVPEDDGARVFRRAAGKYHFERVLGMVRDRVPEDGPVGR